MGNRLKPRSIKNRHWLALTFAGALCMESRFTSSFTVRFATARSAGTT